MTFILCFLNFDLCIINYQVKKMKKSHKPSTATPATPTPTTTANTTIMQQLSLTYV